MKIKSLFAIFIIVCVAALGTDALNFGELSAPLSSLAAKKGFAVETFARKTVYDIVKSVIPSAPFQTLRTTLRMEISASLESLFKRKSFIDVYNSFQGFRDMNPSRSAYNLSLFQFLPTSSSFDSLMYTGNVINAMSRLAGNASIGPYLNTTDAKLRRRNYLSDLFPIFASNIVGIMDKTQSVFFLKSLKMSEKSYRSIAKNDSAVNALLVARKKMAVAVVHGASKAVGAASMEFQQALGQSLQVFLKIASKAASLEGLQLYQATAKCNVSKSELKMKSLLQISLICIGAPENFPILQFLPKGSFPTEAYTTKLIDIAKKLNMSFDAMLQLTASIIVGKYMQSEKTAFKDDPLYYVSRKKGKYIADLQNKTIYEVARILSGLNGTMLESQLNTSVPVLFAMKKIKLNVLSSIVRNITSTEYPNIHFYFLPLSSIITILNQKSSAQARDVASQNVMFYADDDANSDAAKILGITKAQLKRMSLLTLVSRITGKSEKVISENLSLNPMQKRKLKTVNLEIAEELYKAFDIGDLKLNRQSLRSLVTNQVYTLLLVNMKDYFKLRNGSLHSKLLDVFGNEHISSVIHAIATKVGVNDHILKSLTLNELSSALNKSPEDMSSQTLFAVLLDMRKLSRSKIPDPDFDIPIRHLSSKKGILISSFGGKSLIYIIRRVTKSAWQIPLVLKSMKVSPDLKMLLNNTSKKLNMMLNGKLRGYESYNFTIRQLLTELAKLDATTRNDVIEGLKDFLFRNFGIKSLSTIGVNVTALKSKSSDVLPVLSKALQVLRKENFVEKYFRKVYGISPQMLKLLRSKADGDLGQKLFQAATDNLNMKPDKISNKPFQLKRVVSNFGKRFAQMSFRDVVRACHLKKEALVNSSVKGLFRRCLNMTSSTDLKGSLNVSTLLKPFSLDVPLVELGRILNMHTDQMDSSIRSFVNAKTQGDIRSLFIPLKEIFKAGGLRMDAAKNTTLMMLFRTPLFSRFNSRGYLLSSRIFGNNLKIVKDRPIEDLVKAVGIKDKDLSNTSSYDLLKKSILLLKTDPDVCSKLNRMPHLCHKHASCFATRSGFNCRCKGGYDGDGFINCDDKCMTDTCKRGTTCVTLPGKGASCKCNERWTTLKRGKCQRMKGFAIKVTKLRLKQEYRKEYADKNSNAFKTKASEIEDILFNSVCKKIGCMAVVVTSIRQGSLVVDFNVVFSSRNVSASAVQATVETAIKSPEMAALRPDTAARPQASQSDACQSGMAKCDMNEECVPSEDGYTCSCVSGYENKGHGCKKAGGLSFVIIIIIIFIAFIIVVSLIIVLIWRWKRSRNASSDKYAMAYLTNNENETVQLTG